MCLLGLQRYGKRKVVRLDTAEIKVVRRVLDVGAGHADLGVIVHDKVIGKFL
jgi:2-keto-3-deoxy-L-rhamnonate aldolase RhmA